MYIAGTAIAAPWAPALQRTHTDTGTALPHLVGDTIVYMVVAVTRLTAAPFLRQLEDTISSTGGFGSESAEKL